MSAGADADPQLVLFQRQYLQLFEPDFLAWPPLALLRNADAPAWLDRYLFDAARVPHPPPAAYQLRVLRTLVDRVRRAAALRGPGPAEPSDVLARRLDALAAAHRPPPDDGGGGDAAAPPEDAYVTFTCLPAPRDGEGPDGPASSSTITLLERRRLVSGSQVTGFRTWEGALHLGAYLLSGAGQPLIRGRNVLELGAGTGFVALLCAKQLAAKHVTTTDGDAAVVDALGANVALNGLDGRAVKTNVLWWGSDLRGTWVEEDCAASPYDVVVGADIVSHPHLAVPSLSPPAADRVRRHTMPTPS